MPLDRIEIRGARQHNLKNIDLSLPRDRLVVITGLSGSGKSSLAFDTIYAEGQRRYVESLSSYARQFLGQMQKPDVDFLSGLSPSISIQQKTAARNPRSALNWPSAPGKCLRRSATVVTYCLLVSRASSMRGGFLRAWASGE